MESIAEGRRKCKPYIKNQPRRAGRALQGGWGEKGPRLGGEGGGLGASIRGYIYAEQIADKKDQ